MKSILLFTLLLPLRFFAQDDSLVWHRDVLNNKIKTATITTFFINAKDLKPDTASTETRSYDANGRLLQIDHHVILDKTDYAKRTDYFYSAEGKLVRKIFTTNNTNIDSILYLGPKHYVEYNNYPGKRVIREMNGDDISEIKITGKDTVIRKWKFVEDSDRPQLVLHNGKYERADTSYLQDKNGKHTLMKINQYDSLNQLVTSDYYNYSDKDAEVYSACYNERFNMTIFMAKSRNGERSCRMSRKYNASGLLTEKRITSAKKKDPVIVMQVEYSYY